MKARIGSVVMAAFAFSGCATNFVGSPYISGGRAGCEQKCASEGLVMNGLVYMGEYSSACVCSVRGSSGGNAATASVTAGAAGVVMQMRRNEREQQQMQMHRL